MENNPKQDIVEKINDASNILVTVSANPSVDDLAACIGLTLMLSKLDKHATAVFSGDIPSELSFLKPKETLETDTASLRDFIISLDKEKADKLRYKVEDDVVRIFITPYRTKITKADFNFEEGDFNVDLVLALGVKDQDHLDSAIKSHGRILHDATVATINAGSTGSNLGSIDWHDQEASSLSEMLVSVSEALKGGLLDNQISTALLSGIVWATDRFSNKKTTPKIMTMAAQLMAAGADQQLISSNLGKNEKHKEVLRKITDNDDEDKAREKKSDKKSNEKKQDKPKDNEIDLGKNDHNKKSQKKKSEKPHDDKIKVTVKSDEQDEVSAKVPEYSDEELDSFKKELNGEDDDTPQGRNISFEPKEETPVELDIADISMPEPFDPQVPIVEQSRASYRQSNLPTPPPAPLPQLEQQPQFEQAQQLPMPPLPPAPVVPVQSMPPRPQPQPMPMSSVPLPPAPLPPAPVTRQQIVAPQVQAPAPQVQAPAPQVQAPAPQVQAPTPQTALPTPVPVAPAPIPIPVPPPEPPVPMMAPAPAPVVVPEPQQAPQFMQPAPAVQHMQDSQKKEPVLVNPQPPQPKSGPSEPLPQPSFHTQAPINTDLKPSVVVPNQQLSADELANKFSQNATKKATQPSFGGSLNATAEEHLTAKAESFELAKEKSVTIPPLPPKPKAPEVPAPVVAAPAVPDVEHLDVDDARRAVENASSSVGFDPANNPIAAINSQRLDEDNSQVAINPDMKAPAVPDLAPPPVAAASVPAPEPVGANSFQLPPPQ